MIKDEAGKLYHITDKQEELIKINELLKFSKCKREEAKGSYRNKELYLIGEKTAIYQATNNNYMICSIEPIEDNYGKSYKISNLEETDFENLFTLLSLNNLLTESIDVIQQEVNERFEKYRELQEKRGIYYELEFTEKEMFTFYVKYDNFILHLNIDMGSGYAKNDIYLEIPNMAIDINPTSPKNSVTKFLLENGIELLKEYKIQKIKNGVIINDEYFEDIEDGIFILENRKAAKFEFERKKKKLINLFEKHDNNIEVYNKDYTTIWNNTYDPENDKFMIDEKEVDTEIIWNKLINSGYEYTLY
jgi:hypothetical protein